MKNFKTENGEVVIEVVVNKIRQIFTEYDPAPFKERDLDEKFATYTLSTVQEFPLNVKIKLRILIKEESDKLVDKKIILEAIESYYAYEAGLIRSHLKRNLRVSRFFFMLGLLILFSCLSFSQILESMYEPSGRMEILKEGLVILGWVAMWRPAEMLFYDWWPLREKRLYLEKIAAMPKEVITA